MIRCLILLAAVGGFSGVTQAAEDPNDGDIRGIKIGELADQLPLDGFRDFSCQDGISISDWEDFQRCPAGSDGLIAVNFGYDDDYQQWAAMNDKWEGTKIAGHPVLLSLSFDADGYVKGIHARTDPSARPYMRKKAYLLSLRVKSRYGRQGWQCERLPKQAGETPVGGVFVNERCEKSYDNRQIILHTQLFRAAGQQRGEFTNSTQFQIVGDKVPI